MVGGVMDKCCMLGCQLFVAYADQLRSSVALKNGLGPTP